MAEGDNMLIQQTRKAMQFSFHREDPESHLNPSSGEHRTNPDQPRHSKSAASVRCSLRDPIVVSVETRRDVKSFWLPYELLLDIFSHLMASYRDPFDAAMIIIRDISLTCRNFRELVLMFTRAWTYLDLNTYDEQILELVLFRSKTEPLHVRFKYIDNIERIVLRALEHKDRWHYLNADFSSRQYGVVESYPPLVFPSVNTLSLHVHGEFPRDEAAFSRWTFPCADHVELLRGIPAGNSINRDTIKTFKYLSRLGRIDVSLTFLPRLTNFLRSAIALQTFHLELPYLYSPGWIKDTARVELPNVAEFCISNWRQGGRSEFNRDVPPMSLYTFARIIRAMKMPNIRNVSISMAFIEESLDLGDWLSLAFPSSYECCLVTNLVFGVLWIPLGRNFHCFEIPINTIFERFPSLLELSLDAENCRIFFDKANFHRELADFRVLRISNCENDDEKLYDVLRDIMECGASLEEIKVHSKYSFDTLELLKIASRANIIVNSL